MSFLKKIVFFEIFVAAVFSFCIFASAEDADLADVYKDPYGATLCVARKGYWKEAPENSVKAVELADEYGADMVEIDVKMTADGVLVLMADDTVERTCSGYSDVTAVSELTYSEISQMYLLDGQGGVLADVTEERVPTLEQALGAEVDCLFLIDCDTEIKDYVYNTVVSCGMLDRAVFLIRNIKSADLAEWKASLSDEPMTMAYFKGNVIFSAVSRVKNAAESSDAIFLATKVPYGGVFGETVLSKAEGKIRAAADTAEPELCGTIREDSEVWWDDLISRGYSIIITDYVPELRAYIDECREKREALSLLYDELVNNWELPSLKSDKYLDYKLAYNNAVSLAESILADGSSSRSDISTAVYELQKAYDDIINNYEELENGTAGMTVTPVRVALCVIAAAAVIAAQVFVYKKKKKA
ncbi:MAG: glycerophosphodiester phosphodiesterase family protein [Clostridiales bacterium]|nr:glycerophosphodiester phosphodiesterase family protein [Clostridiales bacterium]